MAYVVKWQSTKLSPFPILQNLQNSPYSMNDILAKVFVILVRTQVLSAITTISWLNEKLNTEMLFTYLYKILWENQMCKSKQDVPFEIIENLTAPQLLTTL